MPHLKRPPSEYLREHFWFTTQPIEEPEDPDHLVEMFDWIGWDRMLFSTDYPHWDFDDPRFAHQVQDDRRAASDAVPGQRPRVVSAGMSVNLA